MLRRVLGLWEYKTEGASEPETLNNSGKVGTYRSLGPGFTVPRPRHRACRGGVTTRQLEHFSEQSVTFLGSYFELGLLAPQYGTGLETLRRCCLLVNL